MHAPIIQEPQCRLCNWEGRAKAEQIYARTHSVTETHAWVNDQGGDISYNAVWRHLKRHYKEELSAEIVEEHARRVQANGEVVFGVVEDCDATLATLRHTLERLSAYFDRADDEEMLDIAKTIARVTDAMTRQIDLKARILGYYNNSPEVNLVLIREFKQQVDGALAGVPDNVRSRVLSLVEERAARLPLLQGEEHQRLEDVVAAIEEGEQGAGGSEGVP